MKIDEKIETAQNLLNRCATVPVVEIRKIIAEFPPEAWYEKKWIIVIFGAFVGSILTILTNFIIDYFKKRKKVKILAKDFYNEININIFTNTKFLPQIKKLRREMGLGLSRSHKSIRCTNKVSIDYYKLYLQDLYLLDSDLRVNIYIFYDYLRSIEATSQTLEIIFEKFYKSDPTISKIDIIGVLDRHIKQIEILELIGYDINANFIIKYKDTIDKIKLKSKKKTHEKTVKKYLDELKKDQLIKLKDVSKKLNITELVLLVLLLKSRKVEYVSMGEYKKI